MIFVNLILRPLVGLINVQSLTSTEIDNTYIVTVVCRQTAEAHVRALLLRGLNIDDLHLRELDSANIEDSDRVEVSAQVRADKRRDIALEHLVGRMCFEADVTAARWRIETQIV